MVDKLEEKVTFAAAGFRQDTILGGAGAAAPVNVGDNSPAQQLLEPFLLLCVEMCKQVQFLDSVLANKSDPLSHVRFGACLKLRPHQVNLFQFFWESVWGPL